MSMAPFYRTKIARLVSYHLFAAPCRYTAITCNFHTSFHWFAATMSLNICNHSSASSSGFPKKKVGFTKTGTCTILGCLDGKDGGPTTSSLGIITRDRLFQEFLLGGFNQLQAC